MSLSDEIKAAIGGDGKSRHQTRCLYDYWAIKAEELEAERDRLEERLGDWQRETALAKADRDKLQEALQGLNAAIDYHWNDHVNVDQRMPDAHSKMIIAAQQIAKQALKGET